MLCNSLQLQNILIKFYEILWCFLKVEVSGKYKQSRYLRTHALTHTVTITLMYFFSLLNQQATNYQEKLSFLILYQQATNYYEKLSFLLLYQQATNYQEKLSFLILYQQATNYYEKLSFLILYQQATNYQEKLSFLILYQKATNYQEICCHNTNYVHINGHDRTVTVILAKHYIKLPDDGSLMIRNMLE